MNQPSSFRGCISAAEQQLRKTALSMNLNHPDLCLETSNQPTHQLVMIPLLGGLRQPAGNCDRAPSPVVACPWGMQTSPSGLTCMYARTFTWNHPALAMIRFLCLYSIMAQV